MVKIKNTWNTADLFTKHLTGPEIQRIMELMDHEHSEGRSPVAPKIMALEGCNPRLLLIEALLLFCVLKP